MVAGVLVGNRKLIANEGIDLGPLAAVRDELAATGRTAVLAAVDGAETSGRELKYYFGAGPLGRSRARHSAPNPAVLFLSEPGCVKDQGCGQELHALLSIREIGLRPKREGPNWQRRAVGANACQRGVDGRLGQDA